MKEFNFEKELLGVQDELFRFAYKLTANREKAEDLLPILEDAFQQKVPCIIDCPVDYSENPKLSEYLHDKFEK